jgi:hypothetical protein
VELIYAPCRNGVIKVGSLVYDLTGVQCQVTRLWCVTARKKAMVELVREDILMRVPALMVNLVDPVGKEVHIFNYF